MVDPPSGCKYHSFAETCPVCVHPEYCPAYGFRPAYGSLPPLDSDSKTTRPKGPSLWTRLRKRLRLT